MIRAILFPVVLAVASIWGIPANAQSYPQRQITFINPNPPGGSSDIIARKIAAHLQEAWGRPVIVENRPGASETIGTEVAARAAPDAYTIAIFSNSLAINETASPNRKYDAQRDFIPVTKVADLPFVLVVRSNLEAKTLPEFVALAKSRPGKMSYGHIGVGAPHYLTMEWFKRAAGIDILGIPYKNTPPAFVGLLGGDIEGMMTALGAATPYIKSAQLRPLAAMASKRPASLPTLPTISEFGYPIFRLVPWMGIFVPAGTPPDIVKRLETEIIKYTSGAEFTGYLATIGLDSSSISSAEFKEVLRQDIANWGAVMKEAGVKVQ